MTSSQLIQRRMLLRGAGVAGASLAGVAAVPATASAHEDSSGLLGAWVIQHVDDPPGDPTKVTTVVGFAAGGVFTVQDIAPAGPTGLGAWSSHGDRFRGTFWNGQAGPTPTDHGVTVEIRVRGKRRHDQISGTYRFTVFDAVTGAELDHGTGTFRGSRLDTGG